MREGSSWSIGIRCFWLAGGMCLCYNGAAGWPRYDGNEFVMVGRWGREGPAPG